MRERDVEKYLVDQVRRRGGMAIKWTAPSMSGVPDRIVFLPGGRVMFVEVKRPGEKPRPLQERVMGMLQELGANVQWVENREEIDALFT